MKRINELTLCELADMTEDQFADVVKNEMLISSIPIILPNKPEPPELPKLVPVSSIYKIDGIDFYFETKKDAEKAKSFIMSLSIKKMDEEYLPGVGYVLYEKESMNNVFYDDLKISIKEVYDRDEAQQYIYDMRGMDEKGESFGDRMTEYKSLKQKRDEFASELWLIYRSAKTRIEKFKQGCLVFANEYYRLCGDEQISMTFFKKAYDIEEEEEQYILANYKQQTD